MENLSVKISVDKNGVRGFSVITPDKRLISEHGQWISLLWKHLDNFEKELETNMILGVLEDFKRQERKNGTSKT